MDGTGTMCVDVDECKISGDSICGAGKCMNTYGSFRCKCDQGYRNDMMMEMCMGKLLVTQNFTSSTELRTCKF